jgi:hypothetical protein
VKLIGKLKCRIDYIVFCGRQFKKISRKLPFSDDVITEQCSESYCAILKKYLQNVKMEASPKLEMLSFDLKKAQESLSLKPILMKLIQVIRLLQTILLDWDPWRVL